VTDQTKQLALAGEDDGTAGLLAQAIEKGLGVEALERLVALHERASDRVAAQEFAGALAAFQQECPNIGKSANVDYVTKTGVRVQYRFAPLDKIAEVIRPILAKHGLSYKWNSEVRDGAIRVVCTLRHANGHSDSSEFTCPTESNTPAMSAPQKVAAALSFGRRQSLVQVLGLSATDDDDDGGDHEDAMADKITEKQAADLGALLAEVEAKTPGTERRFLGAFGIKAVEDLPAFKYEGAVSQLEAKR